VIASPRDREAGGVHVIASPRDREAGGVHVIAPPRDRRAGGVAVIAPPEDRDADGTRVEASGEGSLATERGVATALTRSPSSIERRQTNLDEGEPVAKKDEEDVDDQDDGAEDAPPESIGPESRKHVHQDVFTRFWALVKEYGVPSDLGEALSAVAWGMLKNYRRRRESAAAHAGASRAEPIEAGRPAEPSASFSLLLKEVLEQLPAADRDMLHWVEVEGTPGAEATRQVNDLFVDGRGARTRRRARRVRPRLGRRRGGPLRLR
jgi:hypothetical protein